MTRRIQETRFGTALAIIVLMSAMMKGQDARQIGKVLSVEGDWCRKASRLQATNSIYLDDDIHYCAKTIRQKDKLVIRFDRTPPYDRPYECTTPGICDRQAQLWLRGAYLYGDIPASRATQIISALGYRHTLAPDSIIQGGTEVRVPSAVLAQLSDGTYVLWHISRRLQALNCRPQPISLVQPRIDGVPGVYGIYRLADANDPKTRQGLPSALVLITPSDSKLIPAWSGVPEAFRNSNDRYSVLERWSFILHLAKNRLGKHQ